MKWLRYTAKALLIIMAATVIFISFIGIVVLALGVTNLIVGPLLINVVELITTFVVAVGYVITLASSLFKYGKDLFDVSRET